MSRIFYNKLIRDKIPEIIETKGELCDVRVLDDAHEFQQELLKKIVEEAGGLVKARTRKDLLDEYADLMVALDTLMHLMEFSEADIKTSLEENMARKGAYKRQLFLHWSEDGEYHSAETPQGIRTETTTSA